MRPRPGSPSLSSSPPAKEDHRGTYDFTDVNRADDGCDGYEYVADHGGQTETTPTIAASATAPVDTRAVKILHRQARGARVGRRCSSGSFDDALAQQSSGVARAYVDISRDAGFNAAMVSATWSRAERRPSAPLMTVLRHVSVAAQRAHLKLFVLVWHGLARETPRHQPSGPTSRPSRQRR